MNTAALKSFAPSVRRQLMETVGRKLDFVLSAKTPDFLTTFAPQVAALRKLAAEDRAGLIERVAYIWFNRFAALRFMDAHGWHPFRARVLTPASETETQPEILKLARTATLPEDLRNHTDPARLNDLLDGRTPSPDAQGEVYRHLVLAACRFYHALLPDVFEKLDDETELLLPDDLLTEHSVVHGFRSEISDEDCSDDQRANVEILGWLYQFYISERKDEVMARKSAVPTADIPAVTQLFTPHWIVRYLVENSLGRLWLLNRPSSKLREHMPYYIEGEPETDFLKISKPQEIRVLDPAVGSGHMLTYAFDLLTLIYEEEGYAPSDIPGFILRHNLYGLEICPRAAQLAELALVFKAREKSRRFFQPEHFVRPNIIELRDVRFAESELRDYIDALGLGDLFKSAMLKLLRQFEDAKNYGSLIQPCLDEHAVAFVRGAIKAKDLGGQLFLRETHVKVLRVLEQAEALTQRYHVVVANPPYMGSRYYGAKLKHFVKTGFSQGSADLCGCFIQRSLGFVRSNGMIGMITNPNWMFLSSFEELRLTVLREHCLISLIHNGRGVWGSDFGSCAFIVQSEGKRFFRGTFLRLFEKQGEVQTNEELSQNLRRVDRHRSFRASSDELLKVPGAPVAYWLSSRFREVFVESSGLGQIAKPRQGLATADNERFLRRWYEVSRQMLGLGYSSRAEAAVSRCKWFPYNKGGDFRKWYGNNEFTVNWAQDGEEIYDFRPRSVIRNPEFYFKEGVTWTDVSISSFGARLQPVGFLFDVGGSCVFAESSKTILAFLLSKIAFQCLSVLNPTLHFQVGNIASLPWDENAIRSIETDVQAIATEAIAISRDDWDDFEISWDFRESPLLRPSQNGKTLEASWRNWDSQGAANIRRMQELETENNRHFITAYGLEGELQPEVPETQITLARADARRDMAAFLSYAVGCMMGRYSLDQPGLILANAGDTLRKFIEKIGRSQDQLTFTPDEDGIIPVLDGDWFGDDLVARTREFLRVTFSKHALQENVRFIEESLGKDLRKYFLSDFYKDHLQTYKKRPIYWLVQSPRKGFSALIYLHRYTRDTMNIVLNRYLREYQVKLRNRLAHLAEAQTREGINARDKTAARKETDKLTKTLRECEEWERETILPLAQARIELDLDDGVKVNYLKLGEALAPIPGFAVDEG